jgi:hypothetical protein
VIETTRRAVVLFFVCSLGATGAPVFACDSTSCLMLTRGTAGLLPKGAFQLDASFRHADLSDKREGGDSTDVVVRPKVFIEEQRLVEGYHQDEDASENFFQLDFAWGAFSRATVFASLPVFGQRYSVVGHGGVETAYNVKGLGDLVVGGRYALIAGPQRSLVASLGVKVPTGQNDVIDPYDQTILDPTMQPGTGAGDLITALSWSATAGPMQWTLSGSYQWNTTNGDNYKFGNEGIAAVTAGRAFGRFSPSLQLKLWNRPRSVFVDEDVPSTGGTIVYLNGGLRHTSADGLGFYGFLLVPVYRYVNDPQLAPRYSFLVGLSKTF